jgi:hypothetical protein
MTNVIRSADMADKAISVRLDAAAQRALEFLRRDGVSQSVAIRSALLSAARAERYAQMEADAKRIANDPVDRALIAEIQEFFGEL